MNMLFTERKALEEMFSYLEEDKRTIKSQARQDIENIENRQMQILDRLQRLDSVDREAVDVEGVMTQFAETVKELGSLIPEVPFTVALERAGQILAEKDGGRGVIQPGPPEESKPDELIREKIIAAAREQKANAPVKPRPQKKPRIKYTIDNNKGVEIITSILRDSGKALDTKELKALFEAKTGVEYANFYYKLKTWTATSRGAIVKDPVRKVYKLKENEQNDREEIEAIQP